MKRTNQEGILSEKASELFDSMHELQKRGVEAKYSALLRQKDTWPAYADFIAECMTKGYVTEEPAHHKEIRRLFGNRNFFGIEDWRKLGAIFIRDNIESILRLPEINIEFLQEECPFNTEKKIYQTHVIFLGLESHAGTALTVRKMVELNEKYKNGLRARPIMDQDCSKKETCDFCWYLMPKKYAWSGLNISSEDYMAMTKILLDKSFGYELARPVEETVKHSIFFHKNKKSIFSGNAWLPETSDSSGWRHSIKKSKPDEISFHYGCTKHLSHKNMGIALIKKMS